MATATITFDASDYGGTDFDPRRIKVYAVNNTADGIIYDTVGNHQYIGSANGTVASDGTGSITVPIPGTGFIPSTWQTTIHFDVPDRHAAGGRRLVSAGPFTITSSGTIGSKVEEMPLLPVYSSQFLDLVQGYQDHGSVSGAVTINPAIGTHVLDATAATVLTISDAPNGAIVTVVVSSGASSVTVTDLPDAELTDGGFATFVRIRGAWVLAAAGASAGPTDTTPPTAVTGLSATGGSGQVSASWTAATDGESAVSYRWRVWLTSGGASGTWTTTTTTSFLKTGLAAGNYTAEVYAYSGGGASATATATATVTAPAGWSTIITDAFTATDASALGGRTPTTAPGGTTWSVGLPLPDALHIMGNRVNMPSGFGYASGKHTLPVPASTRTGMRISADYELATQTDTNNGGCALRFEVGSSDPNNIVLILDKSGTTAVWSVPQGNGLGNVTMSSTTPLPLTGRVALQVVGTAVTVLLNDTVYATGTASYDYSNASVAGLALTYGRTSYLDNFKVEVFS